MVLGGGARDSARLSSFYNPDTFLYKLTCTQAFSQKRHLNLQRRPVAHMKALGLSSISPGTEFFLTATADRYIKYSRFIH